MTNILGIDNGVTDVLNRINKVNNYSLRMEYFRGRVGYLGVTPTLDVFAAKHNSKCAHLLALPGQGAEGAVALDALRYSWEGEVAYAFPPVQLVPRVIQKLFLERGEAVLVVSEWPSRPWWNLLQQFTTRWVRLGEATKVLERGPTMASSRAELPPGNLLMVLLSCRQ
jgi:hypothetical protein